MDSRSSVDVVAGLYEALSCGDVPALLNGLDAEIAWVVPAGLHYAGTYTGRESVLTNVFARFTSEWEGFVVDVAEILPAGDVVVALGHYRGRSMVTGRSMAARFGHVWRLRDGVPVHFETILDTHVMRFAAQA